MRVLFFVVAGGYSHVGYMKRPTAEPRTGAQSGPIGPKGPPTVPGRIGRPFGMA